MAKRKKPTYKIRCEVCGGTGQCYDYHLRGVDECPVCDGTNKCPECNGTGETEEAYE